MEAHAEPAPHHGHHEMPTEGGALTGLAVSATLHCLTGCAIGEVAGMAIGTAAGFSDLGTIALAVALAFLFGYMLTSYPLLRAGLALGAVIPIALASDTLSIATMEVVDNVIMVVVPGAMESGLGDVLFWGALAFALAIAFVLTVPVNRYLLARGKGHCAVHETGIHGGPPTKLVGAATALAFVFGSAVLIGEAVGSDDEGHGGGHGGAATTSELAFDLHTSELAAAKPGELSFQITGQDGEPITDFEVEHEKRMHLIVVRTDMVGFRHLHPKMAADGTWSTPIEIAKAGTYRAIADFDHEGTDQFLSADVTVTGAGATKRPLPPRSTGATTASGYDVTVSGTATPGEESTLAFEVSRAGEPVDVEPYLGADGHLVALREGDLDYLHVHPLTDDGHDDGHGAEAETHGAISFATEFPSEGSYRLFLQFRDRGAIHTAEFTYAVG